ncbi:MAG TPA: PAS domain S-box protein [Anaerolineales bacterium]|nr:PAS domain S-box protein [Anaerolineales bacterium]
MRTIDKNLTNNGQKPITQTMQTSLQLLPLIMNNIPQAVFWKDRNLVFLGCNKAFAEDAGVSTPAEIVGKNDFDMPWKEQAELYRADDRLVMESGESKLNYEEPHTTTDGLRTWVRVNKIPVQVDGEIVAVLGMYEDITEYKRAQEVSQDEKQRFQTILETMRVPTIISRLSDSQVLYANPAIAEISQVNLDKLIGFKTSTFYANPGDQEKLRESLRRYGHIDDFEVQLRRTDGSLYWALLSSRIVKYEGENCVLTSYVDITARKRADQALLENQQILQTVMDNIPQSIFWKDRNLTYLGCNSAFAADAGLASPGDIVGKTDWDMPWKDQAELYRADDSLVMKSGVSKLNYEEPQTTPEGSTIWLRTSKVPLRDIDGKISAVLGMYEDITEHKRAEQVLQQSEANLSSALHVANMGHWEFDILTQMFTFNDQYYSLHGRTAQEVGGYQISVQRFAQEFVYPEDGPIVGQATQQAIETTDPDFHVQTEARILHADGKPRWVTVWFRVEKDAQGRTIKLHGVNQDITERKQAEQALLENQQFLQIVMDNIPQSIFWKDSNLTYLGCNSAFATDAGLVSPGDILGKTDWDMPWKDQAELYRADDSNVMKSGVSKLNYEEPQTTPDGSTIWLRTSKVPLHDVEGKVYAVLGMYEDITERKRLEQQVQTAFERRGLQVQLSTQVSQSIAAAASLEDLYQRVVTQVKEQFGYYHTQILRYEPAQEAVVLVTGYGEIGAKMLASGHRLPMGTGLIGTAAASGETVLRPALENDPDWHPNPLLPDTKGEIAVPIKLGDRILGVLDVQSNIANALAADDQLLLEGLCGQIATAMESTRLREEMAERLEEINRLYRSMSHEGWRAYRETADIPTSFMFDQAGLRSVEGIGLAEELFANIPLTVPGGEVIGTLAIADDQQHPISPEDQTFAQQVAEQVALALESARLFDQTQAALIESEQLSRQNELILDTAGEGIFGLDQHGNHTFVNPAAAGMLGYSPEELIGSPSHSIWHHSHSDGSHYPAEECPIYRSLQEGKIHQGVEYFWRKDGNGFPVDFTSTPVREGNRILGAVITFRDITERQKAEVALQASEAQLSEALDIARLAHWEYDVNRDRFIFNDQFYSIFHTTAEREGGYELSSAQYAERLVYPDDIPMVGKEIEKALSSTDRHYTAQLEHRIKFGDGGVGYISVNVNIERDENGQITRYYGANQDITERKKAELAIQQSEAQLSEALTIAKLANWEYDLERDRFIFNDHFYSIFHTTAEQVGGYELSSAEYTQLFVHPDDAALVGIEIGKAIASTDRHYGTRLEHRILFADGGMGYISVDVHIERDENGKITRWYGANQDITERKKIELAIQENEAQLSEALTIARLANWEYDVEKDIFTFNDHFYSIFHTTAEQVGGYQLSSAQYAQLFVYPDDMPIVGDEIGKALTSTDRHYVTKLEHRILFADGGIGFISVDLHVERDENGKITRYYGANQDITDRKKAEEIVRQAQQRAQIILESVTIPMVITRLSDNHLTFVNDPAIEVTQFKYEDVINQPAPDFYANPEDRKKFMTELRATGNVADLAVQLRRNNGEVFWALLSARVFDYQGQASILTTFMDITDRIQAEASIAKRAAELQTVAEVSTTTATTLEPDRLLQAVVDLTKEQFGLYHAHIYLMNEAWNTLLLAAGAGEVGRKLVAEEHAIPMSLEPSLVARSARERKTIIVNDVNSEAGFLPNPLLPETCAEMAVPMIVGDKVLGIFDVQSNNTAGFSDEDANIYITLAAQVGVALQNARLYAEQTATLNQLRELDKLKSSFLANMSHELRTPLNSILGFTDVIMEGLDGPLTEHMDSDLRLIQKNGQHLLHLINDVLDMAKIEAGRMNLNPEVFRVQEVLFEVTSITSTLAHDKNLLLLIGEHSDREVEIYADRTRLRQVMINLVNNAIKFTDKGEIALNVSPMDGARVLISVKDTGIGIPPEKLEAIFQEFTQVDASSTRKTGGTGLGLPISRRLVEMHGGRVWAESTGIPGEGSTFLVELPLEARITEVVEKQEK